MKSPRCRLKLRVRLLTDGVYNLRYLKGSRRVWEMSRFASPTPRQAGVSLDIRSPLG